MPQPRDVFGLGHHAHVFTTHTHLHHLFSGIPLQPWSRTRPLSFHPIAAPDPEGLSVFAWHCRCVQGNRLISGAYDRSIRVWQGGACVDVLLGHTDVVLSVAATEERIVSGAWDGAFKIWAMEGGECLSTVQVWMFVLLLRCCSQHMHARRRTMK